MKLPIYVPRGSRLSFIAKGSGIVGTSLSATHVLIDYEGNLYDAVNLRTFRARVAHAAARHIDRAPTIARVTCAPEDLRSIGFYDEGKHELVITDGPTLALWLGAKP